MHEIGVLSKAVELAEKTAMENHAERIHFVTLEIGELTGYIPVFFEKYFPIVTEDKPLFQGARLQLQIVKGEGLCEACETLYNIMKCEGKCPKCGSRSKKILGGTEFLVKEIGIG